MFKGITILILVVMVLSSCTKDRTSSTLCPPCPADISFDTVVIPIFAASCATAGCHDAVTDAYHLNLDSAHAYASATEPGTGNVTPGNAGNSLIYTIVVSGGMPLGLPPLLPCEIQDLECWINQGAKNN